MNKVNDYDKKLIDNAEVNFDNLDVKKSQFLVHSAVEVSGPIKRRQRPLRTW